MMHQLLFYNNILSVLISGHITVIICSLIFCVIFSTAEKLMLLMITFFWRLIKCYWLTFWLESTY